MCHHDILITDSGVMIHYQYHKNIANCMIRHIYYALALHSTVLLSGEVLDSHQYI